MKTKFFITICGEYSTLHRRGHHRRRQEKALVKLGQQPQICAHLPAKTGGGEPPGAALDQVGAAADIAAGGGQPAAGILIRLPTIRSAPTFTGSISSVNSP